VSGHTGVTPRSTLALAEGALQAKVTRTSWSQRMRISSCIYRHQSSHACGLSLKVTGHAAYPVPPRQGILGLGSTKVDPTTTLLVQSRNSMTNVSPSRQYEQAIWRCYGPPTKKLACQRCFCSWLSAHTLVGTTLTRLKRKKVGYPTVDWQEEYVLVKKSSAASLRAGF
jgi:hypothetical protein